MASTLAKPNAPNFDMPGTWVAFFHLPWRSLTTIGPNSVREPFPNDPPALQLPEDAHDTTLICAKPPEPSSPPEPGTSIALRHVPRRVVTTNACVPPCV